LTLEMGLWDIFPHEQAGCHHLIDLAKLARGVRAMPGFQTLRYRHPFRALLSAPLVLAVLAGCGGGGGAGPEAPPAAPLQLGGTAAVGLALADAQVLARCGRGEGRTRTGPDGSYRLSIPGGSLPCVLQLTPAGGQGTPQHGLALEGAVANLTPLTEMVTVRVARAQAAAYFAGFDAAAAARLSRSTLQAAQADVRSLLSATLDLGGLADLLATPLRAATPTHPGGGDAQDRLLDQLQQRLDRRRQVELLQTLAAGTPPAAPGTAFVPWIKVEPRELVLEAGATRELLADINYPPDRMYIRQPVTWRVLEAEGGSVDAISGLYRAPARPGTYHVRATRDDYPQLSASVAITVPAYTTLERSNFSGVERAQQLVLRDAQAWAALWARHASRRQPVPPLPAVDFGREMVLALFAGALASSCQGIGPIELRMLADRVQLRYRESAPPPPGTACATGITTPALLLRVPRSELPVEFVPLPA
jgi:hypothetical protein